ncbi:hypothetical protein FRB90_010942, partial [Tulasnella sp. 427]
MALSKAVRQGVLTLVNLWAAWNGKYPFTSLIKLTHADDSAGGKPFATVLCLLSPTETLGPTLTASTPQWEQVWLTASPSPEMRSGTANLLQTSLAGPKIGFPLAMGFLEVPMVTGGTTDDLIQLNIESFWSGGPFANESYTGGNPQAYKAVVLGDELSEIRKAIFNSPIGETDKNFASKFSLDIGATPDLSMSTKEQMESYTRQEGNAHLELLLFNYGRYLLFSSARGTLPANLQGVWAKDELPPWSADYHANINTQMNYWGAEITDIDVTDSLWDYMEKTWIPRGQQTANILYNTSRGWVTHNEMNIFGHTGMKDWGPWVSATWANYPAAGAWMMEHVIDHLDYGSGSIEWWQKQGWPLVKGAAEFWLDNIFVDLFHDDGTMV